MELINGDCLEKMKDLPNESIDLLFCDLPYGETACKWDSVIDLTLFWKQINRVCKKTTPMFFTCSTKFGVTLINSNPKNYRYDLIWVKSSACGFLNAKRMPMKKHELVYVFYRKLPLYDLSSHKHKFLKERNTKDYKNDSEVYGDVPRPDTMRKNGESAYDPPLPKSVVLEEGQTSGDKGNEVYGKFSYYNNGVKGYEPPLPHSILEIKSERGKHSTQKPIALMSWILKYYSAEEDTILDPTMGSGSTGVACKEMNRKFIGIELDKNIFKIAQNRITPPP